MTFIFKIVQRHWRTNRFRNEVRRIRLQQDLVQLKILDDVSDVTIRNEPEDKSGHNQSKLTLVEVSSDKKYLNDYKFRTWQIGNWNSSYEPIFVIIVKQNPF